MQINSISKFNFKVPNFTSNSSKRGDEFDEIRKNFSIKAQKYPKDISYLKTLAKNINLPEEEVYKLNSIVGKEELKDILSSASRDEFSVGELPSGSKNTNEILNQIAKNNFRLNLHMHTSVSDGKMSPNELIDKASHYANIVADKKVDKKPPFVAAITDHDALSGSRKAVELIAANPLKYKNLSLVLGSELSAIYRDPDMLQKPFEYELVAYSVNPFDKRLDKFLEKTRDKRVELSRKIFKEADKMYPNLGYSFDDALNYTQNHKKGIGGFLYVISNYLKTKAKEQGANVDTYYLCDKYIPTIDKNDPKVANEMGEIFDAFKNSKGFLGVAHPGKIFLGDGRISPNFESFCKKSGLDVGKLVTSNFVRDLKLLGKDNFLAIETNYQYPEGDLKKANDVLGGKANMEVDLVGTINWLNNFRELAKKYQLFEAGGVDNHGKETYKRL